MLFVQGEIELNPYHGHWRYALNLILHQDNASETFSSFQVIQQKTNRAGRISMIGRLSDRMFTLSKISTHQTFEYFFFIPFYPRNIFYILLNYSYSLFTDRNMDSSSWNAQRRKILARVRKAENKNKKRMIPRFVPLKHLISNNVDQVRPLGRWKGSCCRWISWLWSTWPVRSELLWGGHNPLIWVLMALIFLIFCLFLVCHIVFCLALEEEGF